MPWRLERTLALDSKEYRIVAKDVEAKKVKTMRLLPIFLMTSMPPIRTKGSITAVPTHQLALCRGPKAVKTTAMAAGLNKCFLSIASKYFEEIASPETASKNVIPKPVGLGVIIRARIKAVMIDDSLFVGASNM
jgi:hypothetical protein